MVITLSWIAKWRTSLLFMLILAIGIQADVISLNNDNLEKTLKNEVVFVNFYADWCRFSKQLKPIFEDASKVFVNPPGKVAYASVDCDRHPDIGNKYQVNKYPTLKLFRYGELVKKEYRQRSVKALSDFVQEQVKSVVISLNGTTDLSQLGTAKHSVIGYFASTDIAEYTNFVRVASTLRDDCLFYVDAGEHVNALNIAPDVKNSVVFRDKTASPSNGGNFEYTGPLDNYHQLRKWLSEKCVPIVREITFENAEELTEEGLPFLILFRREGDKESEAIYTDAVFNQLSDKRSTINCLIADGKRFAHPLQHLGKFEKDLPVIAIDSFRHMYLFSNFDDIRSKEKAALRNFVLDLHSGKLHREFHHGPDPMKEQTKSDDTGGTTPPLSVFNKLKPAENRYSLLNKEEL